MARGTTNNYKFDHMGLCEHKTINERMKENSK